MLAQKPAALQLCDELGLGPRIVTSLTPRTAFILHGRGWFRCRPLRCSDSADAARAARLRLLPPGARARVALEPFVPSRAIAGRRIGGLVLRAALRTRDSPAHRGAAAGRDPRGPNRRAVDAFALPAVRRGGDESRQRAARFPAQPRGRRDDGAFRIAVVRHGRTGVGDRRRLPTGSVRLATGAAHSRSADAGWRVGHPRGTSRAERRSSRRRPTPRRGCSRQSIRRHRRSAARSSTSRAPASRWPTRASASRTRFRARASSSRAPGQRRALTACTWVSSKWAGRAPQGKVLLRAFLGGATIPRRSISRTTSWPASRRGSSRPSSACRAPRSSRGSIGGGTPARSTTSGTPRLARLEAAARALPGLFVAGSGFRAIGIPDCVADGRPRRPRRRELRQAARATAQV